MLITERHGRRGDGSRRGGGRRGDARLRHALLGDDGRGGALGLVAAVLRGGVGGAGGDRDDGDGEGERGEEGADQRTLIGGDRDVRGPRVRRGNSPTRPSRALMCRARAGVALRSPLEFRLLGPLEVICDEGTAIAMGTGRDVRCWPADPAGQRARVQRPPGRGTVGRGSARDGAEDAAQPGVGAASGARAQRAARDARHAYRLNLGPEERDLDRFEELVPAREAEPSRRPRFSASRSTSGAARRSPTSSSSRSRRPRSRGSRSAAGRRSRRGPRPSSRRAPCRPDRRARGAGRRAAAARAPARRC